MGEFFRGWRRKIGCVTLVMAALIMVGWLRSMMRKDIVELAGFQYLISGSGHLVWAAESSDRILKKLPYVELWYEVLIGRPVNEGCVAFVFECECLERNEFGVIEFGHHQYKHPEKISCRWCRVWYSTIGWPLTLLSAYLILWPGKRPERQMKCPSSDTSAERQT